MYDQRSIYLDLVKRRIDVHVYDVPDVPVPDLGSGQTHAVETDEIAKIWSVGSVDSMETLLRHESVKQDMGRKRPTRIPCHRARFVDWSVCERSRVMGATARMPRPAASGKARIGESLLHALASRVNKLCTSESTSTNGTHRWQ